MNKNNRNIKITFRVSEAEMIKIEQLSRFSNLQMSDLIREAIFTAKIKAPDIPLVDQQSFVELKRMGNNLNQIARSINSGNAESDLIIANIQSIKKNISQLTSYLVNHDSKD